MTNTTFSKGVLVALIILSTNLSPDKANGQSLLKKIQNATNEIGKKIQGKPNTQAPAATNQIKLPDTTAASQSDNIKVSNTTGTHSSNSVNVASNGNADSHLQQHKPEEINPSIQKNLKNIYVLLLGINDEQQMSFKKYLADTARGIYGIEKRSIGSDFIDLAVYTYLNKEELGKTLVEILKTINPKLFYKLDTANVYILRMTISDKPGLNARNVSIRLKKGFNNEQKTQFRNYLIDTVTGIYSVNELGYSELGNVYFIKTDLNKDDLLKSLLKIVKRITQKSKLLVRADNETVAIDNDDESELKVFEKLEIEATFPGGNDAYKAFLQKNLDTTIPKKNGAPAGTYFVNVRFLVLKDGSITDVRALNTPGYGMEKEAVRVIIASNKWNAGEQNYWWVNSYKTQPIAFVVSK